jgi:hypothetical protein
MRGIATAADAIASALRSVGVRAVTDARLATPPCVVVVPVEAEFDSLQVGVGHTLWHLHCLAPQPGAQDSFEALAALVADVITAVPDVETAQMTSYRTADNVEWPALRLATRQVSSWT